MSRWLAAKRALLFGFAVKTTKYFITADRKVSLRRGGVIVYNHSGSGLVSVIKLIRPFCNVRAKWVPKQGLITPGSSFLPSFLSHLSICLLARS